MSNDESIFDAEKNYYVFKYVVDSVTEDSTEHEGEIQAFVKATNPWEAVENAGFDDMNAYGANCIDNRELDKFKTAIANERKHLKKVSKQLKEMTIEHDAKRKKILEERECPNGCGKMDKAFRCGKCGFGHEKEELTKDIDKMIKEEKKKGNDTSELESIKKVIKDVINKENDSVNE